MRIKILIFLEKDTVNNKYSAVRDRIISCFDLVAAEAIYHHACYVDFFRLNCEKFQHKVEKSSAKADIQSSFSQLCTFLENNDE